MAFVSLGEDRPEFHPHFTCIHLNTCDNLSYWIIWNILLVDVSTVSTNKIECHIYICKHKSSYVLFLFCLIPLLSLLMNNAHWTFRSRFRHHTSSRSKFASKMFHIYWMVRKLFLEMVCFILMIDIMLYTYMRFNELISCRIEDSCLGYFSQQLQWRVLFSWIWYRVALVRRTDFSEEHIAS